MKLKNILACLLCVFTLVIFVGCKDKHNTKPITMDRYFNSKVASKNSSLSSGSETLKLSSFTGKSADLETLKNRVSLSFNGETSWIYSMYIECVYVTFYANKDIKLNQLSFTINDLDKGDVDHTLPDGTFKKTVILSANIQKNKGYQFKVPVNATAQNSQLTITFELQDTVSSEFKWTLYGFSIYGETR